MISNLDANLYMAYLTGLLSAIAWIVLWRSRSPAVHAWCSGGLCAAALAALVATPEVWAYATHVYIVMAALLGLGAGLGNLVALWWLAGQRPPFGTIASLAAAYVALAALLANAPDGSTTAIVYILAMTTVLQGWSAYRAARFSVTLALPALRWLAASIGCASVASLLMLLSVLDDGVPGFGPMTFGSQAFGVLLLHFVTTVATSALFITVVLQLVTRQARRTQRALAMEHQRLQLIADVHAGFGARMASGHHRAECGQLPVHAATALLEYCRIDLLMVLETLDSRCTHVGEGLRLLRHHIQDGIRATQAALTWDIEVEDAPTIDPRDLLRLLRLVHDALTNALRHARAARIVVSARYGRDATLSLCVRDDGIGMPDDLSEGFGIRSMRAYARELGATLSWARLMPGTCVRIDLNLGAC